MKIEIVKGIGTGKTKLSAFDGALINAGIGNYNLIELSSVIPENSIIVVLPFRRTCMEHEYGHRLYVVIARKHQNIKGKSAVAGLGWVQKSDGSGLFVEHNGESEEEVERLIKLSLGELISRRLFEDPAEEFGEQAYLINLAKCMGNPVYVIVVAVFCSKGWM